MAALSDYLENKIIEWFFRGVAFTPPTTVHLALFTTIPNDDGTGATEVSGGGYARQPLLTSPTGSSKFTAPAAGAAGKSDNNADITFPTATADWGTIKGMGLYDASTAGNLLWHGPLYIEKVVRNGDTFKILTGDLDVSFS